MLSECYYKLDAYVYIKLIESDIIIIINLVHYLNITSLMPMFMSCYLRVAQLWTYCVTWSWSLGSSQTLLKLLMNLMDSECVLLNGQLGTTGKKKGEGLGICIRGHSTVLGGEFFIPLICHSGQLWPILEGIQLGNFCLRTRWSR